MIIVESVDLFPNIYPQFSVAFNESFEVISPFGVQGLSQSVFCKLDSPIFMENLFMRYFTNACLH